jgi:hypothetical protein
MEGNKKILKYILSLFVVLSFVFVPCFSFATVKVDIPDPIDPSKFTKNKIFEIADRIVEFLYQGLFIVSVGFFILSLYGYFTAGGDSTKIKKVSKQLLLAVITMALGLVAYGIASIVESFLSGKGGTP